MSIHFGQTITKSRSVSSVQQSTYNTNTKPKTLIVTYCLSVMSEARAGTGRIQIDELMSQVTINSTLKHILLTTTIQDYSTRSSRSSRSGHLTSRVREQGWK